jgi:Rieske 2Fe-2S family protein
LAVDRPPTSSPLTPEEVAALRAPFRKATLLPGRAYHDGQIYAWEAEHVFFRDWIAVGRAEELPEPGSFVLRDFFGEPVILVRGRDDMIRAFYNVCRHRGTAVEERECGKAVRFQCPYHAWIYDLDGRLIRARHTEDLEDFSLETFGLVPIRTETWQGFVFLCFDPAVAPLAEWLDDLPGHLAHWDLGGLRRVHRVDYEVAGNWKLIAENYSECYHCPPLHPQLNALTPYDVGSDYETEGPWQGGWMELVDTADTMALGGGGRCGVPLPGMTALDERRIYYYVLWPLAFISIHPDYLLVHRLLPQAAGRTTVICEWYFDPASVAAPDFDPSQAIAFWDLTNRQDWKVCEMQQRGTASRSWRAGRYSTEEASVHAFDLMCADRYAGDGARSRRTVRERYDVPPPQAGGNGSGGGEGVGPAGQPAAKGRRATAGHART